MENTVQKHISFNPGEAFINNNSDFFIPAWTMTPRKLVLYEKFDGFSFNSEKMKLLEEQEAENNPDGITKRLKNLENNENIYGELSENSIRRLRKALDFMFYTAGTRLSYQQSYKRGEYLEKNLKNRLVFITLTLSSPQIHTDTEIKGVLLDQFLTEMRSKWKMEYYIWKAEKQANGNIHFHILSNKALHWKIIRKTWNRIQNKLGYIDRYTERMKEFYKFGFQKSKNPHDTRSYNQQYEAYKTALKTGFTDPNSTDIKYLYDIRSVRKYVSKYLTKQVDKSKDDRKADMQKILMKINDYKEVMTMINPANLINEQSRIEATERNQLMAAEVEKLEKQFADLKAMGIEGRIWGASQRLSKLKNLGGLGNPPDMELIAETAMYKKSKEISSGRYITTYIFDINKTPDLKLMLDKYIYEKILEHELSRLNKLGTKQTNLIM